MSPTPSNRASLAVHRPAASGASAPRALPVAGPVVPVFALAVLVALVTAAATAAAGPLPAPPVRARDGMVVSQSTIASRVGADILARGGNAVDAAVATAFALAVTHPEAGNIGGGGFLVARLPDGRTTSFDFREVAPARARSDMFLRTDGRYDSRLHHWSHLAVGVPGSVAGLHLAHERLGRFPWARLVEPAIRLAREGFVVTAGLARSIASVREDLERYPASRRQFLRDGDLFAPGDRLIQRDLARALERIRDRGPAGFYRGETAKRIEDEMRRGGGWITREDLEAYRAVERPTVHREYHGHEIISMAPPSSGGVTLLQMLGILEPRDLRRVDRRSPREVHLLVEAMRRAYADRARWLGDPDQVTIPIDRLLSAEYLRARSAGIRPDRASRSAPDRFDWPAEGEETTHLSVVDSERLAVSLTTTLEQPYGSRIVVPGAGFLLNNEMGDFNPSPGETTEDGRIGTRPNLVAPRKRMLSSMTPTIVSRHGRVRLVLGSPGGRTIINTVLLVLVDVIDRDRSLQEAIDAPRLHHQWLPDRIVLEREAVDDATRSALERMGHHLVDREGPQGSVMGIAVLPDGSLESGVDRRRPDGGAAGH